MGVGARRTCGTPSHPPTHLAFPLYDWHAGLSLTSTHPHPLRCPPPNRPCAGHAAGQDRQAVAAERGGSHADRHRRHPRDRGAARVCAAFQAVSDLRQDLQAVLWAQAVCDRVRPGDCQAREWPVLSGSQRAPAARPPVHRRAESAGAAAVCRKPSMLPHSHLLMQRIDGRTASSDRVPARGRPSCRRLAGTRACLALGLAPSWQRRGLPSAPGLPPTPALQILLHNATNYSKGILSEILDFVMGQGLIPADGEVWKVRRRCGWGAGARCGVKQRPQRLCVQSTRLQPDCPPLLRCGPRLAGHPTCRHIAARPQGHRAGAAQEIPGCNAGHVWGVRGARGAHHREVGQGGCSRGAAASAAQAHTLVGSPTNMPSAPAGRVAPPPRCDVRLRRGSCARLGRNSCGPGKRPGSAAAARPARPPMPGLSWRACRTALVRRRACGRTFPLGT